MHKKRSKRQIKSEKKVGGRGREGGRELQTLPQVVVGEALRSACAAAARVCAERAALVVSVFARIHSFPGSLSRVYFHACPDRTAGGGGGGAGWARTTTARSA